jgi:Tfp pilus assembly protein PilF
VPVKQVAEELGVRHVLEGSIKTAGNRIRVTANLIDALAGNYVWSERYDRELDDLFALQDDITHQVALALQVELSRGEMLRLRAAGLTPEAFRLAWTAARLMDVATEDNLARARTLLTQAQDLSPEGLFPLVMLGWVDVLYVRLGASPSRESGLENAEVTARRVLENDKTYPEALMLMGMVNALRGNLDQTISWYERAVEANPNHADAFALFGEMLCRAGRSGEGIQAIVRAKRLSPHYPAWMDWSEGVCHMMIEQFDEAVRLFQATLDKMGDVWWAHMHLAGAYARKGYSAAARTHVAKVMEMKPDFSIEVWAKGQIYKHKRDLSRAVDTMRLAGLPEKVPTQ